MQCQSLLYWENISLSFHFTQRVLKVNLYHVFFFFFFFVYFFYFCLNLIFEVPFFLVTEFVGVFTLSCIKL